VGQELLTLPDHPSSPPFFFLCGVRVDQSFNVFFYVWCYVDHCSSLSVGQCTICPSSMYVFCVGQCTVCPSSMYDFCVGQCTVCPSSMYDFCVGQCTVCPSSMYCLSVVNVLSVRRRYTTSEYPFIIFGYLQTNYCEKYEEPILKLDLLV
jgi:hypothetical protein